MSDAFLDAPSPEWFQSIVEGSGDAIFSLALDGEIRTWNAGAERLYGFTAREAIGGNVSMLSAAAREDEISYILMQLRGGRTVDHFDSQQRHRDGRRVLVSLAASPVKDAAGIVAGGAFVVRDLAQLIESEATSRAIVDAAVDAIITIDERGLIESFNPAAERVFGYAAGAVIGENVSVLMPEPYHSEHAGYVARYRETGEKRIIGIGREVVGRRKDGETFPMDLSIGEVQLGDRRIFTGIVRDLSERKSLESQKMEIVGRLAGGVAQDINNLMTTIIGHAVLGPAALETDDPLREDFDAIRTSAEDAASLAHQLLAFAQKQVVEPQAVNLNATVGDMRPMLERLIDANTTLDVAPGEGLGLAWLDPNQFEHVVMNLVLNARDAMPRGGRIGVATANVDVDERAALAIGGVAPGAYVMLSVSDTGEGLTPEARAHLFEPFFTTKERGKGIGLATSYGIVRQAGGGIRVESSPGAGTVFEIYLPRIDVLEIAPPPERRAEPPRGHERILIVEDEEAVRKIAAKILERMGYEVIVAQDGMEALRLLAQEPVALVMTDVVMPKMGGVALMKALRERGIDAKVLFVSGYAEDTVALQSIGGEARAFLQKPFSPAVLAGKVRDILDAR
jgi:PAS domain S-box-containing protein